MNKVLIAIGLSKHDENVISQGCDLARLAGATVYLVHVVLPNENIDDHEPEDIEKEYADELGQLNHIAARARQTGLEVHAMLMTGVTSVALITEAKNIAADVIVIGRSRSGIEKAVLGGVSERVIRDTMAPVLVVP